MPPLKKAYAPNLSSAFLNDYLTRKNSPMKDQGQNYMEVCEQYDIDPRFLVALSGAESQFGANITWGRNNAWNWGWNQKSRHNSPFDSWRSGMVSVAKNLRKDTTLYDLSTTSTMYGHYCNGDCTKGSTNLHTFMAELGADESALGFPIIAAAPR